MGGQPICLNESRISTIASSDSPRSTPKKPAAGVRPEAFCPGNAPSRTSHRLQQSVPFLEHLDPSLAGAAYFLSNAWLVLSQ